MSNEPNGIEGATLPYKLNTLDPNMLFSKWYPWQMFLDRIAKYPNVHGARTFLMWYPGKGREQDNIDTLPYIWYPGKKKWDVVNWNPEFIKRFVAIVTAFAAAKKYLVISLRDYCSWRENTWSMDPWNYNNNIQKYGTTDYRQSHWTSSDMDNGKPKGETHLSHFWAPLLESIKLYTPASAKKYIIIEAANEPFQSLDPTNIITRWVTQFYQYPSEHNWVSTTSGQIKNMWEYGTEGNCFDQYSGVCSVHNCREAGDLDAIIAGRPKDLYKKMYWRPDSDGAKTPDGKKYLTGGPNNLTLMKPEWIKGVVAKHGCFAVMLHADDGRHTDGEWKNTFNHMENQLCKAF